MEQIIQNKIRRIKEGQPLRTLDLFSGAGGLSLGFHKAGFEIVAALEIDNIAAQTHEKNFHDKSPYYSIHDDVTKVTPLTIVKHYLKRNQTPADVIDVVIGGPPCQPFSRVGRAKLREVAGHPEAFVHDVRVSLYTRFLAMVEEFQPIAFVMENVKDIGRFKGRNIPEEIASEAGELGYNVRYSLLNSAWYGVPQMRERMIIIGIHKSLDFMPSFPLKTHDLVLPKGYTTSRSLSDDPYICSPWDHYVREVGTIENPKSAVTAEEALGDLPAIFDHLDCVRSRGARKFDELKVYSSPPNNPYQRLMREWPGFENDDGVYDHVIRRTPRDYEIFRLMAPGDQYPQAYHIANKLFEDKVSIAQQDGITLSSDDLTNLKKETVPPYDPNKYPNKWRKMERNLPTRTLMAHLSKDCYSHIHYDCEQARTISVREAARLQSFPDGFRFCGSMIAAFRQIGNAVPPLMAYNIANNLKQDIILSASSGYSHMAI